jgi:hypothetical protein
MAIPLRLTPPTTIKSPLMASRKDFRLWLGVALILTASLIGGKVFSAASHRTPAVVLTHDLAAGSTIRASDVQLMNVALPNGIASITSIDGLIGKVATRDLIGGSLLNPLAVSETSNAALRSVSVPIKAGHLPLLSYGARVDVWFTPSIDGAIAPGPSTLIAENVLVEAVPDLMDNSIDSAITLRISDQVVVQIMQALRDGSIDIAVVDGARNG